MRCRIIKSALLGAAPAAKPFSAARHWGVTLCASGAPGIGRSGGAGGAGACEPGRKRI